MQWYRRLNNLNIQQNWIFYADYTMARICMILQLTNIFMDPLINLFFTKIVFQSYSYGLQLSVLTPTDFCHAWAIFGPLEDKNTPKGELIELPGSDTRGLSFIRIRSLPLRSFPELFLNVLPYQLESWFIHWVGCTTYWVHISLERDPCDLHQLES